MLIYWYLFSTLNLQIDIKTQSDTGYEDIFGEMSKKAQYLEDYRIVCSFCMFCVVLELIPRLEFVNVIHRMLNVLSRAQTSLIFFLFLNFLLMVGFSFTAYFLFGETEDDFHTYERAFLSCFLMMVGRSRYSMMSQSNSYIAPFFYVLFMCVFYYFFYYMFITIVCVYYVETEEEKDRDNIAEISIFEQISTELQEAFDKIPTEAKQEEIDNMTQSEIDQLVIQKKAKLPLLYRLFAFFTCKKFQLKELQNDQKRNEIARPIQGNSKWGEDNIAKNSEAQKISEISPILEAFIQSAYKQKKENEEPTDLDLDQPTEWIEAFENSLSNLSDGKLQISNLVPKTHILHTEIEFYPKHSWNELDEKTKTFLNLEIQKENQESLWMEATIEEKYKFWKGMEVYNAENYFSIPDALSIIKMKQEEKTKDETKQETNKEVSEEKKEIFEEGKEVSEEGKEVSEEGKEVSEEGKEVSEEGKEVSEERKEVSEKEKEILQEENESSFGSESNNESLDYFPISIQLKTEKNLSVMCNSPEYRSSFSRSISESQHYYWNKLSISEKMLLWLKFFTGKERNKVWKCLQFSRAEIEKYLQKNFFVIDKKDNYLIEQVWKMKGNENQKEKLPLTSSELDVVQSRFQISLLKALMEPFEKSELKDLLFKIIKERQSIARKKAEISLSTFLKIPTLIRKKTEKEEETVCCPNKKKREQSLLTIEEREEEVLKLSVLYYDECRKVCPDEERLIFWNLMDQFEQTEIFFNQMDGPLITSDRVLQDIDADIMVSLLSLRYPRYCNDNDEGRKLDQFINKQLNKRQYNKIIKMSNLQSKMSSLKLSKERLKMLNEKLLKQEQQYPIYEDKHNENLTKYPSKTSK